MKKIRLFTCMCALAVLGLGFTGCDDKKDDAAVEINEANLVGKWYVTNEKGYNKYMDHPEWSGEWDEDVKQGNWSMTIHADHTLEVYEVDEDGGEPVTAMCGWSLSGNKFTIIYDEEDSDSSTVTVKSLTKSQLQLEEYDKGTNEDGPYEYCSVLTLKK